MTDPASSKPPVVASLERSRSVYFDQNLRHAKEHNCWSLRVDWRALVLLTLTIMVGGRKIPRIFAKGLGMGRNANLKAFLSIEPHGFMPRCVAFALLGA